MVKFLAPRDVLEFCKVFGFGALQHAIDNQTISPEQVRLILDVKAMAYKNTIVVEDINDGNRVRETIAEFTSEKILGKHLTMCEDVTIIVTGQGGGEYTITDAMKNGELNAEKLGRIMDIVRSRNEMRDVLES